MKPFQTNKASAWLLAATLAGAGPVHATAYTQTNLVASTEAYGARIVDPTLINGWGIAASARVAPNRAALASHRDGRGRRGRAQAL